MKFLGTKFFGQESAICLLDTREKTIFAISSDRISRIKKDNYDVSPILDEYNDRLSGHIDEVSYSFSNFNGRDAVLETKGTSYYWLNFQRRLRKITKPRFRDDLSRKVSPLIRVSWFFRMLCSPGIFWFWAAREFYWRRYRQGGLKKDFHFRMINRYIKETLLRYRIDAKKVAYHDHHTCHAYSAYYTSPFQDGQKTVVFTLDEHGDETFSKVFICQNQNIEEFRSSPTQLFWKDGRVHVTSIADIYSNFTEAMGLVRSTDEGKVEALAAYGAVNPELLQKLRDAIRVDNLRFGFREDLYQDLANPKFLEEAKERIGEKDFCATVQNWLETTVVDYLNMVHSEIEADNLCLAGGVVANVIMNHKIYDRTPFNRIYVVPAMGDEGSALGASIISAINNGHDVSWLSQCQMPYFGPQFSSDEVEKAVVQYKDILSIKHLGKEWPKEAAERIANEEVIGVFQGRMEFGPRALGNRSILANPQSPSSRDRINASIKRRPYYQPFCPTVLEEERERLYENSFPHKHMATAFMLRERYRHELPSAIHVDGTSRPQFIQSHDNPPYYELIKELKKLIGFGVVINTSFNLHGRPVVHSPKDAVVDFLDCNMDALFIEGFYIQRK